METHQVRHIFESNAFHHGGTAERISEKDPVTTSNRWVVRAFKN